MRELRFQIQMLLNQMIGMRMLLLKFQMKML